MNRYNQIDESRTALRTESYTRTLMTVTLAAAAALVVDAAATWTVDDGSSEEVNFTSIQTRGDLNHDDRITPADAVIALAIVSSGAYNSAADVSGDGCVTSLDALMILQAAAGGVTL